MLSSASDKTKLFAENLSETYLKIRTNLKLHNISVTPKMAKKVIMNLDLSKAYAPDSQCSLRIPVQSYVPQAHTQVSLHVQFITCAKS